MGRRPMPERLPRTATVCAAWAAAQREGWRPTRRALPDFVVERRLDDGTTETGVVIVRGLKGRRLKRYQAAHAAALAARGIIALVYDPEEGTLLPLSATTVEALPEETVGSESMGMRLRQLREDAGMTRIDLSLAAGVQVSTIQRMEEGRGYMLESEVERVEKALGAKQGAVRNA